MAIHSALASFAIATLRLEDALYQSTAIALLISRPQTLIFKDSEQLYSKFMFYHTFTSLSPHHPYFPFPIFTL